MKMCANKLFESEPSDARKGVGRSAAHWRCSVNRDAGAHGDRFAGISVAQTEIDGLTLVTCDSFLATSPILALR